MSGYTAEMTELYTAEPETEPHIVIAKDKTVIVPDELKSISTQYEKNIETVTFDCPRYWDEHDLSTMRMYINFRRADGVEAANMCGTPVVDETDENIVHFDWTISDFATYAKGKLSFVACAKMVDGEGVLQNRWASRLCQDMEILEGIEPNYAEILEPSADIIEQLLYKLDTAAAVAVDAAERAIAAAQSATVINKNMLDNWYFADPVNQRGKTEYTGTGYTIDRWAMDTNNVVLLQNNGIRVIFSGTFTGVNQIVEKPQALSGKTVTFSALIDSAEKGFTRLAVHCDDEVFSSPWIDSNGVQTLTFAVPDGCQTMRVRIQGDSASAVHIIAAAKLEIGDKQTLAHQDASGNWVLNDIPDYGDMLLKCQRYYQLFSSAEKRPSDKRDFRPELRTNATAANTGTIEIEGVTYYYADANL